MCVCVCVCVYIWNVQNRQICRHRELDGGCQGLGRGDSEEGQLNVFGVSCGGDENVLELDRGGGLHNIVSVLNTTESYTLKWLSLCYVNFTSVKKKKWIRPNPQSWITLLPLLQKTGKLKYQGLFKWVSSSHWLAKVLEFQLQHQSFQWTLRTDLL